jgi:hypothetical protein
MGSHGAPPWHSPSTPPTPLPLPTTPSLRQCADCAAISRPLCVPSSGAAPCSWQLTTAALEANGRRGGSLFSGTGQETACSRRIIVAPEIPAALSLDVPSWNASRASRGLASHSQPAAAPSLTDPRLPEKDPQTATALRAISRWAKPPEARRSDPPHAPLPSPLLSLPTASCRPHCSQPGVVAARVAASVTPTACALY